MTNKIINMLQLQSYPIPIPMPMPIYDNGGGHLDCNTQKIILGVLILLHILYAISLLYSLWIYFKLRNKDGWSRCSFSEIHFEPYEIPILLSIFNMMVTVLIAIETLIAGGYLISKFI